MGVTVLAQALLNCWRLLKPRTQRVSDTVSDQGPIMARSLTIKQEETAQTSWIMTGFLVLAFGWLAATAIFASTADATPTEPVRISD